MSSLSVLVSDGKRSRAREKTYHYYIQQGQPRDVKKFSRHAWYLPKRLCVESMRAALADAVGTHDFR